MAHPTFDANGYPSEETLRAIREWGVSERVADLRALFSQWDFDEWERQR